MDMDRGSWMYRHDRVNLFSNAIKDAHSIMLWPIECKDESSAVQKSYSEAHVG